MNLAISDIYLDEQEVFIESSKDEVVHVNQVVEEGENLSLDASSYYLDESIVVWDWLWTLVHPLLNVTHSPQSSTQEL